MTYNSFSFLLFFPIVFIVYYLIGKQYRYIYLCIVSAASYLLIGPRFLMILLAETAIIYTSAMLISSYSGKGEIKKAKVCFAVSIIACVGILAVCKYSSSFVGIIGVSFYTLQLLGYLIDVYRGSIEAESNFVRLLLFASFFPTIVCGPIERSTNLLQQIKNGVEFDHDSVRTGYLTILWGYYIKFVIADMIHPLVISSFESYENYGALNMVLATALYSIEIYADFSGYSYMAIGTAKMLGFDICENFKQPYFATSIKDFWRRWHISLSKWLRDYIYIPLGGSRCSKIKLYRNLFITFLISGIWHGTGWCFVFWGILHGLYQILGDATINIRNRVRGVVRIDNTCFSYKLFRIIGTFIVVSFAWFFFRADSFRSACSMLRFGMQNMRNLDVCLETDALKNVFIAMLPMVLVDIIRERGIILRDRIIRQNYVFRWSIYVLGAAAVIVLLLRNYGVSASDFIYAQF